jgi:uncharacterized membrane protein YkvA (DUF1232 family)
MGRFSNLRQLANGARLATMLLALWKLFRHAETPFAPKLVAISVLAYAVSPIDLVPDFIPVIGLLDDIVLIPLGVALAVRLTPPALWHARLAEAEAEAGAEKLPRLLWGAVVIVLMWLLLLGGFGWWLWSVMASSGSLS